MNLITIKQIAQTEMSDKRSSSFNERGDKYAHGERVAKLAVRLRQLIFPNERGYDDILTVAAWFHDICNDGGDRKIYGNTHAWNGAIRTRGLLTGHCTAEELEQICAIIAVHDDRKKGSETKDIVLKIHQDADHIDHFGSLDIWRFVCYAVGHNNSIEDALSYLQNGRLDDETRWRSELHFDLSRKIQAEKLEFSRKYFERLRVECAGKIWQEDTIKVNYGK